MTTVQQFAHFLQTFAPLDLAADWDNVGLLLGDPARPAQRVMTCLTITPDVVDEARVESVHLIVSHHPILFKPGKKITLATTEGRILLGLMEKNIAVYCPHTAFDNCAGGINDILARRLGLEGVTPLRFSRSTSSDCKIAVFVPEKDLEKVSEAMFAAGAGAIGQYRECSFRVQGTGTFFGGEGTNPAVGERGRREEVSELRLEVVCSDSQVAHVVRAMKQAHSYEEPAYDVYALRPGPARFGQGRFGALSEPVALADFAAWMSTQLGARSAPFVGPRDRTIARVAIACGAAGEFWNDAVRRKADVFVTGEMRLHDILDAQAEGLALVLPGHYWTERPAVEELAEVMQKQFPAATIFASRCERDPLQTT